MNRKLFDPGVSLKGGLYAIGLTLKIPFSSPDRRPDTKGIKTTAPDRPGKNHPSGQKTPQACRSTPSGHGRLKFQAMKGRSLYLAAYDISGASRLRKALHVLLDYAEGRQKSVFECRLTPAEVNELLGRIQDVIDLDEDRFALVRLDDRCKHQALGKGVVPTQDEYYYIG